jgi:Protein of unknown function (DUF2844)
MNLTRFALPAAVALLAATPALAALGADATSVQADLAHMKGSVRVTEATGFSVHEISTSWGGHVREFTGSDGKVFAVAWDGPVNPDLRQVLGSYYDQFVSAAAAVHGSHRHLAIAQPGLVVQNNGRMRAFSGRAWVPAMLPQNFTVEQIQ